MHKDHGHPLPYILLSGLRRWHHPPCSKLTIPNVGFDAKNAFQSASTLNYDAGMSTRPRSQAVLILAAQAYHGHAGSGMSERVSHLGGKMGSDTLTVVFAVVFARDVALLSHYPASGKTLPPVCRYFSFVAPLHLPCPETRHIQRLW